jgi:hypothetical protein
MNKIANALSSTGVPNQGIKRLRASALTSTEIALGLKNARNANLVTIGGFSIVFGQR